MPPGKESIRIAMWSGPRNISTAMMRAWENRPDTAVLDEPLYGPYLHDSGSPHPIADEVISAQGADWRQAVEVITGNVPGDRPVFYQKHMTHHLLAHMKRDWMDGLINCFLIRDPREVLLSYSKKRQETTLEDIGIAQQLEIFDYVCQRTGVIPPVIDSKDVLLDPRGMLTSLCEQVGVPYTDAMLSWPAGSRASDGVWSKHWYGSVEQSTGFVEYVRKDESLPESLLPIAEACDVPYRTLYEHRLRQAVAA